MDYLEGSCIWCGNEVFTYFQDEKEIKNLVLKRFCRDQCAMEFHNSILNPSEKKPEPQQKEQKEDE